MNLNVLRAKNDRMESGKCDFRVNSCPLVSRVNSSYLNPLFELIVPVSICMYLYFM